MTEMIFFGGLLMGFLIGWIGLAFLTMSSLHTRKGRLTEPTALLHEETQN